MGIKIDSKNYVRSLHTLPRKVKKNFAIEIKRELADIVVEEILAGKSPVKGKRFKKYSRSYRDQIEGEVSFRTINGKVVPLKPLAQDAQKYQSKDSGMVNMMVKGEMLNSLTVKQTFIRGQLVIFFRSLTAKYHDKLGAGKKKVIRRLLPTRKGEVFKASIQQKITKLLKKAFKKSK